MPKGATRLIVFYLLYFGLVGVTLPFMPQYFTTLGLSSAQVGALLAVGPTFALLAPPLWGQLADRTGRPGVVLLLLSLGGVAGYAALSQAHDFVWVLAALALSQVFTASVTTVIDSLALHHVARVGGNYASIRIFGSLGFVLATLAFGFAVTRIDVTVVYTGLGLLLACSAWCAATLARAPREVHAGPGASFSSAWHLLKRREVALFLLGSCLHWVACAPYHGVLSMHFTAMGLAPKVVSLSSAVAVSSELGAMMTFPRWSHRVSARTLLLVAFGASALRWWGMALTSDATTLVVLAAIHGLTFGAFYVASVAFMAEQAPDSLRATGQSLFVAATFGVGGLIGFIGSGQLYDTLGGHRLFGLAGVLEVLPMVVLLLTAVKKPTRVPSA